jgi:hypothetical protein
MVRRTLLIITSLVTLIAVFQQGSPCSADQPMPQAPASLSWLPHGYGLTMHADNTTCSWQKGIHGFRSVPEHTGCWSHPMWGWDVNGYYRGPQVLKIDPADCQLPIGLIYPSNSPPGPPPRGAARRAARSVPMPGAFMH